MSYESGFGGQGQRDCSYTATNQFLIVMRFVLFSHLIISLEMCWLFCSEIIRRLKHIHEVSNSTAKEGFYSTLSVCLSVGWFVGRIAQKLMNTFSQNLAPE